MCTLDHVARSSEEIGRLFSRGFSPAGRDLLSSSKRNRLMPPVDSAAILAVEHDAASERLAIRFASGEAYFYDGVPRAVYEALLAAPSKGGFFQAEIRGRYSFARL